MDRTSSEPTFGQNESSSEGQGRTSDTSVTDKLRLKDEMEAEMILKAIWDHYESEAKRM